jgi:WD40 repeat protein
MGMSWCPQDHSLLLSCSKDHRTICWDVSTTDIVCEMPTQDSWSFDVQVWSGHGSQGNGEGSRVALEATASVQRRHECSVCRC